MSNVLYKITPLEKKNIKNIIEVYRQNEDESISWFTIEDQYRWGHGFVESKHFLPLNETSDVYCNLRSIRQYGCCSELDDQVGLYIEFSEDLSREEREEIEKNYETGGNSWLYDGDHEWLIESDFIVISAPYQIDQVNPQELEML